jgi:hypothetical protein
MKAPAFSAGTMQLNRWATQRTTQKKSARGRFMRELHIHPSLRPILVFVLIRVHSWSAAIARVASGSRKLPAFL